MPGLDPGIHRTEALRSKKMDCRVKPGNDGGWINDRWSHLRGSLSVTVRGGRRKKVVAKA